MHKITKTFQEIQMVHNFCILAASLYIELPSHNLKTILLTFIHQFYLIPKHNNFITVLDRVLHPSFLSIGMRTISNLK